MNSLFDDIIGKDNILFSFFPQTDERITIREGTSYVDYQTHMVSLAKKIAMTSQEMVGKSGVNPAELGSLANQLTRDYDLLASNSAGAAEASSSPDVSRTWVFGSFLSSTVDGSIIHVLLQFFLSLCA